MLMDYESGFIRISMGVQIINTKLLELFDRKGSVKMIFTAMENLNDFSCILFWIYRVNCF